MSESLCLGHLINHPPKLTFSSPVGATVVTHDLYNPNNFLVLVFLLTMSKGVTKLKMLENTDILS